MRSFVLFGASVVLLNAPAARRREPESVGQLRTAALLTADGERWQVVGVRRSPDAPTFNLTVSETATYFVGHATVLAHNTSPCDASTLADLSEAMNPTVADPATGRPWRCADGNCTAISQDVATRRRQGRSYSDILEEIRSGARPIQEMQSPDVRYFGADWERVRATAMRDPVGVLFDDWSGPLPGGFGAIRPGSGHALVLERTGDSFIGVDVQRGLTYSESELRQYGVGPFMLF